jgi:hypothetical protein
LAHSISIGAAIAIAVRKYEDWLDEKRKTRRRDREANGMRDEMRLNKVFDSWKIAQKIGMRALFYYFSWKPSSHKKMANRLLKWGRPQRASRTRLSHNVMAVESYLI